MAVSAAGRAIRRRGRRDGPRPGGGAAQKTSERPPECTKAARRIAPAASAARSVILPGQGGTGRPNGRPYAGGRSIIFSMPPVLAPARGTAARAPSNRCRVYRRCCMVKRLNYSTLHSTLRKSPRSPCSTRAGAARPAVYSQRSETSISWKAGNRWEKVALAQ
jgi:hypothetical protein